MSTYVISDIHGCYKEFLSMLDKISFSGNDLLILAGDYIDRGSQNYEMLRWLEHCPPNVRLIQGNHDAEFAACVDMMLRLEQAEELESDFSSNPDAVAVYESVKYTLKSKGNSSAYFDLYGTIGSLLQYSGATLGDLQRWRDLIHRIPYFYEQEVGGRTCVVVHAGYAEKAEDIAPFFPSLENFYLYARGEECLLGGKRHGMVIAGHTPTIAGGVITYNAGKVFRHYDKEKDCVFYDIDCGCAFREWEPDAGLACIRLEDEAIFYTA